MKRPATISSLLLLGALHPASLAGTPQAPVVGAPAAVLEEVLAPYRQLEGLHYRARYSFTFWDAAGLETYGESSAEYWGSGEGFRSETEVDRRLSAAGMMGGMIVTYDGLESRMLFRADGFLVLRRGEIPDVSLTPNPIFLPIDFLKARKFDCQTCRATLADIRASGPAASYLPQGASLRPGMDDAETVVIALPAIESEHRKEILLTLRSGFWFVKEVALWNSGGTMTSRYRFSDPIELPGAPPGFAPARSLVVEGWGEWPNGAVRMEMRGEVTQLELNPTFYWGEFTIPLDTDLAQTVVDGDTDQRLRVGSCKAPVPERPNPFDAP